MSRPENKNCVTNSLPLGHLLLNPLFIHPHTAIAVRDVIRDKAALAGIKTSIARKFRQLRLKLGERPLQVSGFLLFENLQTLSSRLMGALRTKFLTFDPEQRKTDKELIRFMDNDIHHGAVPIRPSHYELISEPLHLIKSSGVNR